MKKKSILLSAIAAMVLLLTSKWFGVTYAADRQSVVEKIQSLIDDGTYPAKLF